MPVENEGEKLARRAIEDRGFKVHDANIVFHTNCPNIDLVVFGKRGATYVQVKTSKRPAGGSKAVILDGSPWTDQQHGKEFRSLRPVRSIAGLTIADFLYDR